MVSYRLQSLNFENGASYDVCHKAFCNVFNVSNSTRKTILRHIRKGQSDVPFMRDEAFKGERKRGRLREVLRDMKTRGFELSREEQTQFTLTDSYISFKARAWMTKFFALVGQAQPNSFGEVIPPSSSPLTLHLSPLSYPISRLFRFTWTQPSPKQKYTKSTRQT